MSRYSKAIAAAIASVLAAAGVIASSGLLHGTAEAWVNTGIAAAGTLATTLAVYYAPKNTEPAGVQK